MEHHFTPEQEEGLAYAFGHLVSSYYIDDAHHSDSGELALEIFEELDLTPREITILELVAEQTHDRHQDWRDQGVLL